MAKVWVQGIHRLSVEMTVILKLVTEQMEKQKPLHVAGQTKRSEEHNQEPLILT